MVWFVFYNDTWVSVRTLGVMYDHIFFSSKLAIIRPDIKPHIKLAVSLVIAYGHFLKKKIPLGFIRVNIFTLSYPEGHEQEYLTLKLPGPGMGEVVPARTSPTLHPPSPPTVLSLYCLKCPSA